MEAIKKSAFGGYTSGKKLPEMRKSQHTNRDEFKPQLLDGWKITVRSANTFFFLLNFVATTGVKVFGSISKTFFPFFHLFYYFALTFFLPDKVQEEEQSGIPTTQSRLYILKLVFTFSGKKDITLSNLFSCVLYNTNGSMSFEKVNRRRI